MSIEYKGHWDALRMLNRKRPLSYRARLVVGEEGGKRGILRPSLFPLLPPCDPCYTNPLQATLSLRPIHSTVFTPTFDHHRSSQCLTYNSKFNFVWIALMTVRNMVKKYTNKCNQKSDDIEKGGLENSHLERPCCVRRPPPFCKLP